MAKNTRIIEGQLNLFDLFKEEQHTEEKKAEPASIPEKQVSSPASKSLLKAKEEQTKAGAFKECTKCWCSDCKHNAVNEGVPRDICGTMQACPACDMCISTGVAEICVIGSAKEGCSVRAAEEGMPVE